ncbi:hypothetical protein EDD22DRAFT_875868 [Suillus occidentalis]|nr:hypothetical protein EDD22DRAFT_875868 [Suillus occidentalis]
MNFFWKNSHVSRAQVLVDIDSVLDAILNYCSDNMDSLTQEERSSFMDEHSSLSGARSKLNKGMTHSTLTKALNECEELKLKIQTTCRRHKEDGIRRGLASPAATTIAETNSTISILAPSTTLVDSNRTITSFDPSPTYRTSPSERPISVQSNFALTNGSHLGPSYPSTDTISLAMSSSDYVARETPSITSSGSITLAASAEENPCASPTDTDCMIFSGDSVGSPTFNIDSEEATGATLASPGDSPSLGVSGQRLPPTGARQAQTAHTMRRERVMYFGPGTAAGSPTFNIRSPRATGVFEQVAQAAQRSELLTESFQT